MVDTFPSPGEGKFIYHPRGEGVGGREEGAVEVDGFPFLTCFCTYFRRCLCRRACNSDQSGCCGTPLSGTMVVRSCISFVESLLLPNW